jgi:hypothetical protein
MNQAALLSERLRRQRLVGPGLPDVSAVVRWAGAVQAQDLPGALWALTQRVAPAVTEASVLAAFDAGALIRTHVLRPTWHFAPPEDLRWMLALTGPRVHAACATAYRSQGLDAATRVKADGVLVRSLEGGYAHTRHHLAQALQRAGIATDGLRLVHLLLSAELEGVICSGPRAGKHLTYSLLDERIAPTPALQREEALTRLMSRYFASHGPATIQDAAWWSGLTQRDVREGIALAGDAVVRRVIDEQTYWSGPADPPSARSRSSSRSALATLHLLPCYDEYTVAYRDRTALLHGSTPPSTSAQSALLSQPVMLAGRHVGSWRRTVPARPAAPVLVDVQLLERLTKPTRATLTDAVDRYATFLGRPVTLNVD